MSKWWVPPSGSAAMTVEIPASWKTDEVDSKLNLIALTELKLQKLIQDADDPEETMRQFVRNLENAGLLEFGMTDVKKLAKAEYSEICSVLENPDVTHHLVQMCGTKKGEERLRFPQQYNSDSPRNGAPEITLEDWTDEVTQGMYAPEWE